MILSFFAGAAAALAGIFFGLRANMLKPAHSPWADSPTCVRLACLLASLMCNAYALVVSTESYSATRTESYSATLTELAIFSVLAVYAFILWRNLHVGGRAVMAAAEPAPDEAPSPTP